MLDADTFLTELYVMVDDFCKANLPADTRPGPEASLSRSEVVTLAIFGQWGRFASERDRQRSRSWPSASSPCATVPIPACQAWVRALARSSREHAGIACEVVALRARIAEG